MLEMRVRGSYGDLYTNKEIMVGVSTNSSLGGTRFYVRSKASISEKTPSAMAQVAANKLDMIC